MRRLISTAFLLAACSALAEGEHPACGDVDQPYRHLAPDELRSISAGCSDASMAYLMEHRARHAQLVEDHAFFDKLERTGRSVSDWRMDINQIFLSLVEVYTGAMDMRPEHRMSVLHTAYARANEIAELRLLGYDPQAARLEAWEPAKLLMNTVPEDR